MIDANARLQAAIESLLPAEGPLRVLEAGCGSTSHLRLRDDSWLVGIDISERQLARNGRLNESVIGDLQRYQWQPYKFDLVVCWDVLEHLADPRAALLNLFASVKEGGLLTLAMPLRNSLKGLVTRLTPFGFHAWFYQHVIGDKRERADLDQFPTYLRADMHPRRVIKLAAQYGFTLAYSNYYEGPVQQHMRRRSIVANSILSVLKAGGRLLTFGAYDPTLSDCMLLLRRSSPVKPDAKPPGYG
ncbi:MAG: hypothetical protein EFKGCFLK_02704 [Rhodocyclaceae bacterium]|nr:class I SAM-dependent methyltransferase [Zoogloeaceae bacterium]MBV6409081.1 hypothetical protein [Rhodocyclaceae bacterium]